MMGKLTWNDYHQFMRQVFVELDYEPSPEQWEIHLSTAGLRQVVGGERAGKSYVISMDAVVRMLFLYMVLGIRNAIYWIVGPDYAQPRAEFDYIIDALYRIGMDIDDRMISKPTGESAPWILTVPGTLQLQTKSGADIKKIASKPLHGAIYAEAAQGTYDLVLKLAGRVAQHAGWVVVGGTLEKGLPWYGELYKKWQAVNPEGGQSFSMPTWSNTAMFPGGRQDPKIKRLEALYPGDLFDERFAAIPMRPAHLVFSTFERDTHIAEVKFDKQVPVWICIDPGYYPGAYAVGVFQFHKRADKPEIAHMIDEIYVQRTVGEDVIKECKAREWWANVFLFGGGGVMDTAGAQHHAQISQLEVWQIHAGLYLYHQKVPVLDGIDRHRTILIDPETNEPRVLHAPHCLNTFGEYDKYRYPEQGELVADRSMPIDKHNHMMKAMAYLFYHRYGPVHQEYRLPEPTQARLRVT